MERYLLRLFGVFNRAVSLKDSWAKQEKAQPAKAPTAKKK